MKYITILSLAAAAATGFVIPDEAMAQQLFAIEPEQPKQPSTHEEPSPPWWERMPSYDDLRSSIEETLSSSMKTFDSAARSIQHSLPDIELESIVSFWDRPLKGHGGHHGPSNLTIYEAISTSKYTTKLAALVDKYPDIVDTLNSTSTNLTLFAPTDKAFEKIPDHHRKPPKEFIEKLLKYHVVPGFYPAGRILASHTLPTAIKEDALGGNSQRLRVSVGLFGVRINFYSKVTAANIFTKNGVIHGINSILIPPPRAPKIITLFPSKFSTFELAFEKTALGKELQGIKSIGGTLFAPSNWAFRKLGPSANAFLFNTEKGLGYLKALLKYHIVINETLYSDAYYGKKSKEVDAQAVRYHVDLPTLLDEKSLSIDVARWGRFITFKINGFTRVAIQDVVAKDSVVHVVDSVLIPPHAHKGEYVTGEEIEVEELVERLEQFVENQKDWSVGEL